MARRRIKRRKPAKKRWSRTSRVRGAITRAKRRIRELLAEGAMKGVREERRYVKRLQKLL